MSGQAYKRLDIKEFGTHLLQSGDLDPVYIALHKMELDEGQLFRWLVAYWCLYHCGAACHLSECDGPEFWKELMRAARNDEPQPYAASAQEHLKRWPRGSERRYFRGEAAIKAVKVMWGKYLNDPAQMVRDIIGLPETTPIPRTQVHLPFKEVSERAQQYPLYGPWIAFKICDMLDQLGIQPVDVDQAAVFMFDSPAKAAEELYRAAMKVSPAAKLKREVIIPLVVSHLEDMFKEFSAPPHHSRAVGLFEIETVLCKHAAHIHGHYPLFNDIVEISEGILNGGWHRCETAKTFLHFMPRMP